MNNYIIRHPLFIRIKDETQYQTKEEAERNEVPFNTLIERLEILDIKEDSPYKPYFSFVTACLEVFIDGNKMYKNRNIPFSLYADDYDQIVEAAGGKDNIKIGKEDISLDAAIAEVETAILSAREEHEREAARVELYRTANDHYAALDNYGYHYIFELMQAQENMNRNRTLDSIRDELKHIGDCLEDIRTKM